MSVNVMELAALLVDDEPLARRALTRRLEDLGGVRIVGEAANGREALESIRSLRPDVVFLDIRMPGLDGLDVAGALEDGAAPLVVFVTAYDEFAVEAFERRAVDYLLKPVDPARLEETLTRVRARARQRDAAGEADRLRSVLSDLGYETDGQPAFAQRLAIRDRGATTIVACDDIDWIEAAGDYVCIHVGPQTHILRETMKSIIKRLDPTNFKRVHRSAIVNLTKVKELNAAEDGSSRVVLHTGSTLRLGRNYRSDIREVLTSRQDR